VNISQIQTLDHNGASLAFESVEGAAPTFLWLGGFKSDMGGTKAEHVAAWAASRGQAFVRFDYSGHGRSGGRFEDGGISQWLGDALAIIDQVARGAIVVVGSSMGAWIALLAARARPQRIRGLLLIAPAVDFTERLMWASFPEEVRRQILETGRWDRPSEYDPDPYPITRTLIEDGRAHLLMDAPIPFDGPVHILQGGRDPDVPEAHARALASLIRSPDLVLELIPDGDHRLSRPPDLARLTDIAADLADRLSR
jgi:pimeloyl-ACP methyl ester carboxylesterase